MSVAMPAMRTLGLGAGAATLVFLGYCGICSAYESRSLVQNAYSRVRSGLTLDKITYFVKKTLFMLSGVLIGVCSFYSAFLIGRALVIGTSVPSLWLPAAVGAVSLLIDHWWN